MLCIEFIFRMIDFMEWMYLPEKQASYLNFGSQFDNVYPGGRRDSWTKYA